MKYNKKMGAKIEYQKSNPHTILCRSMLTAYFFIMTVVFPLYAPGGYLRIGEVKFFFFRNVTLVMVAAVCCVIVISALIRRDKEWILRHYLQMSVTDWFVYGYCLVVMLSYLCSSYKKNALWGAEGWYMGVVSQIIFVLLYFFFSRYFCFGDADPYLAGIDEGITQGKGSCVGKWFGVWLTVSAVVFLLGICNRYSLYPIKMEGQTATFISTLGNINWFCGYWSITAPVGITLYWCCAKGAVRTVLGLYSFFAMLSGITQGSNSAYLVFLALLFVLLFLSLQCNHKLYRFLELCMIFAAACQAGRLLQELPGLSYNYWSYKPGEASGITGILISSNASLWAFFLVFCCYAALRLLERYRHFCIGHHKWLWGMLTMAAGVTACLVAFLMMVDSGVIRFQEVPMTMDRDSYLVMAVDENWGNGRAAAWIGGMDAYRNMDSLHKLIGIGPDCFAEYIYDVPKLAGRIADRFGNLRLTNAHNEWLTVLINTGVLGLFCYAGIFATAFIRFIKKAEEQTLLYVCAVALLTYTAHNVVSFQQVLNTPYIFMILGIGEGLRHYRERSRN